MTDLTDDTSMLVFMLIVLQTNALKGFILRKIEHKSI